MTLAELDSRVSALERELAALRRLIEQGPRKKDWRRTVGMFAGDPVFAEIVRLGREWRERQNRCDDESS